MLVFNSSANASGCKGVEVRDWLLKLCLLHPRHSANLKGIVWINAPKLMPGEIGNDGLAVPRVQPETAYNSSPGMGMPTISCLVGTVRIGDTQMWMQAIAWLGY